MPVSPPEGLCGRCVHARTITSDRGSRFLLCRLSREDPRFARYPRLPVWRCPGFRQREDAGPEPVPEPRADDT